MPTTFGAETKPERNIREQRKKPELIATGHVQIGMLHNKE